MLEQLTPDPFIRIAELIREWVDSTCVHPDRMRWIMQRSRGFVNPNMVQAYLKGWDNRLDGRPPPGLNEDDGVRRGYADADQYYGKE